jgi:2-polyprenyl-3-methyl-5-hydroxy-6-metoxy-1,4-benzoquinol methylase
MCGSDSSTHRILGKRLDQSQGMRPWKKSGTTTTVAKCSHCGLIYSNPQPVPENIQDHYGVAPEDYWKEDYFRQDDHYFRGEIEQFIRLRDFRPGMKALDIGAGLGKTMAALSKVGFDVYGFEPSAQFHERAISSTGFDRDRFKLGSIEEMQYPPDSFDFITFGAVLEHLYDPSAAIEKAMTWLKTGGLIHIEVPSADWLVGRMINLYYKLALTDYVGNISPMHEPYHLYEFSLKSFQQHALRSGYKIVHHEYYVCQTFMPRVVDYIIKPIMRWTDTGMQLCVWLGK